MVYIWDPLQLVISIGVGECFKLHKGTHIKLVDNFERILRFFSKVVKFATLGKVD